MNINQLSEGQTVGWKYFPVINTLLHYLDRKDLIELSKCSKFYRKQLEKQVFEKLDLYYYKYNISEIYEGLQEDRKIEKISELLKSDLGPKLKLVQSVNLDCEMSRAFAETFVKLLPNINALKLDASLACDVDWQQGLITALSCIDGLEHVEIEYEALDNIRISTKNQLFPKSLKSLIIYIHRSYEIYDKYLYLYDTIDSTYINLHTISIYSNRLLQNLSSGLPNLQKVEIEILNLDKSEFIKFIKANPQIRNLDTRLWNYNEEMIKTILSSIHLERWFICSWTWEDTEVNCLPSNYSIKHLRISYDVPAPAALKIINACKGLETLDLSCYIYHLDSLEWPKIERRINILKLSFDKCSPNDIKEIDASRLFNNIHIKRGYNLDDNTIKRYIDQINNFKLNSYKFITLTTKSFILKLINKTD